MLSASQFRDNFQDAPKFSLDIFDWIIRNLKSSAFFSRGFCKTTRMLMFFCFVMSRVQEPDLVRLMSEEEGSSRLTETPDLLILSNDIPTSPTEELVITGEEEDDPGQYYNTPCGFGFLAQRISPHTI